MDHRGTCGRIQRSSDVYEGTMTLPNADFALRQAHGAPSVSRGGLRIRLRIGDRRLRIANRRLWIAALAAVFLSVAPLRGQRQMEQDEYTAYELLAPDTAAFKIDYEVSATTSGATSYFNPIRKGSVASDEAVFDIMTGLPLK